jgi:hypothetical protein
MLAERVLRVLYEVRLRGEPLDRLKNRTDFIQRLSIASRTALTSFNAASNFGFDAAGHFPLADL